MCAMVYADALGDYRCKCAACRRTCCGSDWDIIIAKGELDGWMASANADTRVLAQSCVEPNPHARGHLDRYRCRMNASGTCSALSPDGLCTWQLATGSCVGRACTEFPRSAIEYLGNIWMFGTLACEAVVEPLLRREDPIRLTHILEPYNVQQVLPSISIDNSAIASRPLLAQYPEIVDACIAALQDRHLALVDRVALVTHALHGVGELEETGEIDRIPAVLTALSNPQDRQHALTSFGRRANCDGALLTLLGRIYTTDMSLSAPHIDISLAILSALGFAFDMQTTDSARSQDVKSTNLSPEQIRGSIRLADPNRLPQLRALIAAHTPQYQTFMEHLAVTEFLHSLTPIVQPGVRGSATLFACWYIIMTLSLAAIESHNAQVKGTDQDQALVDAVVRIQRIVVHSQDREQFSEWLNQMGLSDTYVIVPVIRSLGYRQI